MNTPMVSEGFLEEVRASPYKRRAVRSVDGTLWEVWANRGGTVRLTRTAEQVIVKPQGATGEGAGPGNPS